MLSMSFAALGTTLPADGYRRRYRQRFRAVRAARQKALCRPVSEPNVDEYYAAMESEILEKANALNIGPQGFGGKTTALSAAVEFAPTHIAGLPVAVNIGCHVTRHVTAVV